MKLLLPFLVALSAPASAAPPAPRVLLTVMDGRDTHRDAEAFPARTDAR